jgi:pimeloyl-ACP methyl ester carboxylesterase
VTNPPEIPGAVHRYAEIQTADAGPLRVHYAEAGSGPPLLLLHGWPQHFWCWRSVVPLLSGDFRLICPDLRGFGWTSAPGRGYDSETFAADAVALLDALGVERAGVIGHDWGGFTGFLLALNHPHRVERFLALSTPIPWVRLTPRVAAASWRTWYVWVLAVAGRRLLVRDPGPVHRAVRTGPSAAAIDAEAAEVYAERLREPGRAHASQLLYRSYVATVWDMSARGRYDDVRLTVPTRLLLGSRDAAISPALIRGFEPHADDMTAEIVEGAGHFLPEERPELVATYLSERRPSPGTKRPTRAA